MTDTMKIKQAIAVLTELEQRYIENVPLKNLIDLRVLLQKIHHSCGSGDRVFSVEAEQLAKKLLACIKERKPNFREPNLRQWSLDMDKLIRIDKRSISKIEELILWTQQDDFWQDNILSPYKLRLQLDKLEFKMEKDSKWKRDQRLRKPHSSGKTARERYLESLDKTCRIGGVEAESSTIGRGDRATN